MGRASVGGSQRSTGGDNTTDLYTYFSGQSIAVSHQYQRTGVYTVNIRTVGTPLDEETVCESLNQSFTFLYPAKTTDPGNTTVVIPLISGKAREKTPNYYQIDEEGNVIFNPGGASNVPGAPEG